MVSVLAPRKVRDHREKYQECTLRDQNRNQGLKEVALEVINRDRQAHVRRRDHLTGHTEDHGHAHQIQVTHGQSSHNRHHDCHVTLREPRQNTDDEAHDGNDHRNRQSRYSCGNRHFAEC